MDRREEDVIIACGLYLLAEKERRKNENTGFHGKRCLVSHWPTASEIGVFLITTFAELRW
jgi:hypothetical protein